MRDALYALLGAILYLDGLIVFVFRVSTKHGIIFKINSAKAVRKKENGGSHQTYIDGSSSSFRKLEVSHSFIQQIRL